MQLYNQFMNLLNFDQDSRINVDVKNWSKFIDNGNLFKSKRKNIKFKNFLENIL